MRGTGQRETPSSGRTCRTSPTAAAAVGDASFINTSEDLLHSTVECTSGALPLKRHQCSRCFHILACCFLFLFGPSATFGLDSLRLSYNVAINC